MPKQTIDVEVLSDIQIVTASYDMAGQFPTLTTKLRAAVAVRVKEPRPKGPAIRVMMLEGETVPRPGETVTAVMEDMPDGQTWLTFTG